MPKNRKGGSRYKMGAFVTENEVSRVESTREEEVIRHKIVRAYLALLKQRESEEISITEITQAAGVSRMAFYRKFQTKRDVVDFFLGGIMHWEVCWDEATGRERSIWELEFGIRFFEVMREHRDELLLLVDRGYATLLLRAINQTNECVAGDMPSSSIDRYRLYFLAGAGFNAMLIWLRDGCRESPEDMACALAAYMGRLRQE